MSFPTMTMHYECNEGTMECQQSLLAFRKWKQDSKSLDCLGLWLLVFFFFFHSSISAFTGNCPASFLPLQFPDLTGIPALVDPWITLGAQDIGAQDHVLNALPLNKDKKRVFLQLHLHPIPIILRGAYNWLPSQAIMVTTPNLNWSVAMQCVFL